MKNEMQLNDFEVLDVSVSPIIQIDAANLRGMIVHR
jgi:hypothetical protein